MHSKSVQVSSKEDSSRNATANVTVPRLGDKKREDVLLEGTAVRHHRTGVTSKQRTGAFFKHLRDQQRGSPGAW